MPDNTSKSDRQEKKEKKVKKEKTAEDRSEDEHRKKEKKERKEKKKVDASQDSKTSTSAKQIGRAQTEQLSGPRSARASQSTGARRTVQVASAVNRMSRSASPRTGTSGDKSRRKSSIGSPRPEKMAKWTTLSARRESEIAWGQKMKAQLSAASRGEVIEEEEVHCLSPLGPPRERADSIIGTSSSSSNRGTPFDPFDLFALAAPLLSREGGPGDRARAFFSIRGGIEKRGIAPGMERPFNANDIICKGGQRGGSGSAAASERVCK